jgi:hypothetical protein
MTTVKISTLIEAWIRSCIEKTTSSRALNKIILSRFRLDGCVIEYGAKSLRSASVLCFERGNIATIDLTDLYPSDGVLGLDITKELPSHLSSKYDHAIAISLLEHIDDRRQAMRNMADSLTKRGKLYVSVPFLYPIHADPFDFARYTPEGLQFLIEESGLKILSVYKHEFGFLSQMLEWIIIVYIPTASLKSLAKLLVVPLLAIELILNQYFQYPQLNKKSASSAFSSFTTIVAEKT